MQIAYDKNYKITNISDVVFDKRIKYYCCKCGGPIYCNESQDGHKHFSHKGNRSCQTYQKRTKEWVVSWQKEFPKENRNVLIKSNGKEHIADICIGKCVVILQHDYIPKAKATELNDFFIEAGYNTIWLVYISDLINNEEVYITSHKKNQYNNQSEHHWVWKHPWCSWNSFNLKNYRNTVFFEHNDNTKQTQDLILLPNWRDYTLKNLT